MASVSTASPVAVLAALLVIVNSLPFFPSLTSEQLREPLKVVEGHARVTEDSFPEIQSILCMAPLALYHPCTEAGKAWDSAAAARRQLLLQNNNSSNSSSSDKSSTTAQAVDRTSTTTAATRFEYQKLLYREDSDTTRTALQAEEASSSKDQQRTSHLEKQGNIDNDDWCYLFERYDPSTAEICSKTADNARQGPSGGKPQRTDGPYLLHQDCPLIQEVRCGLPRPNIAEKKMKNEEKTTNGETTSKTQRRSKKKSKGRALVLYMMHMWEYDGRIPEWGNFELFWKTNGVLGKHEETQLFDGVDYVFYRISDYADEVTLCVEKENVKFLWVPPGPCDLCAHARVLEYLGYGGGTDGTGGTNHMETTPTSGSNDDLSSRPVTESHHYDTTPEDYLKHFTEDWYQLHKDNSRERSPSTSSWPYRQVVFLNSGVRGPFHHKNSSHWIDLVSIGRTMNATVTAQLETPFGRAQFWNPHDERFFFRTIWGIAVSMASIFSMTSDPHMQSYFLSLPIQALDPFFKLFRGTCYGDKFDCIIGAEMLTLDTAAEHGLESYSSLLRTTFQGPPSEEVIEDYGIPKLKLPLGTFNPNLMYNDPCLALFVKFGGDVFVRGNAGMSTPAKHKEAVNILTLWKKAAADAERKELRHEFRYSEEYAMLLKSRRGKNTDAVADQSSSSPPLHPLSKKVQIAELIREFHRERSMKKSRVGSAKIQQQKDIHISTLLQEEGSQLLLTAQNRFSPLLRPELEDFTLQFSQECSWFQRPLSKEDHHI